MKFSLFLRIRVQSISYIVVYGLENFILRSKIATCIYLKQLETQATSRHTFQKITGTPHLVLLHPAHHICQNHNERLAARFQLFVAVSSVMYERGSHQRQLRAQQRTSNNYGSRGSLRGPERRGGHMEEEEFDEVRSQKPHGRKKKTRYVVRSFQTAVQEVARQRPVDVEIEDAEQTLFHAQQLHWTKRVVRVVAQAAT